MKQLIDIETWERKDNFKFFSTFLNPTFSITSEVECSGAKARAKKNKESFFLHYLYAVLRAANEIKEFRYRIEKKGIVLYDQVDMLTPIRISENGRFAEALIPYHENFETFHREAKKIINSLSADAEPYGIVTNEKKDPEENFGHILLSALPDLYFTSITSTQQHSHGCNFPLMNAGKAIIRDNRLVMPLGMTLHHGFVDGYHISLFYKRVEELLK
ncbi:MAG: chloramphenicol acetyltransferase [Bacteroidales bacterium]